MTFKKMMKRMKRMKKNNPTWKERIVSAFREMEDVIHSPASDIYFETSLVYIRIFPDCIRFAARKCFDRWANSEDFVLYYPLRSFNDGDARAIIEFVHHLINQKKFSDAWGRNMEFSIRQAKQYWRKEEYRRSLLEETPGYR